ncbi:hypothetical protein GCM10007905_00240 [Mixta theicola]|nr:hypothetical protein GCM10007905_00240 [Mixta theicola]
MRKARVTDQQIITDLKSVEADRMVKEICREAGHSVASDCNWKAKYGGMEASDIKKIKDLADENRGLKQMFAVKENSVCQYVMLRRSLLRQH